MAQALELWRGYGLSADLAHTIECLKPLLRTSGAQAVIDRRFPQAAINAMIDAGLFGLGIASEVGGLDADPLTEMQVYERVARINVSAAWNLLVGNVHTGWVSAYMSDEAVQDIFPQGHRTVVAGQAAPTGRAVRTTGGLRVTGRYSWGSGISHSSWIIGGFRIEGEDAAGVFAVPKDQVTILDNWHVIGIEGSGSYDFSVDDVFVPDGFWFDWPAPVQRRGGPKFRAHILAQASVPHSAVALGGAEHAFEAIATLAAGKKRYMAQGSLAERGAFQRDLGRAYLQLSAARDNAARLFAHLWQRDCDGPPLNDGEVAEITAMGAHACEVAVDVASLAFKYGGGTSVRLESSLQRVLRDVLVAQQHLAVADSNYDLLGQAIIAQLCPE